MSYWWFNPTWQSALEKAHLNTLQEALEFHTTDEPLSEKKRSRTWKTTLPNGQLIFVKQDFNSSFRATLRQLIRLQKPITATEKERLKISQLTEKGFHLPEIIAYGASPKWGFPDVAAMIMLPVPGRSVEDLFKLPSTSPARKREVAELALKELSRLQNAGCNWLKDCKPEHFFITDENQVSLIDVERMHFRKSALPQELCERQRQRFLSLLPPPLP